MLTACGGGGGNNNISDINSPVTPVASENISGHYLSETIVNNQIHRQDGTMTSDDLNILKVDGRSYTLLPNTQVTNKFYIDENSNRVVVASNHLLDYAQYGLYKDDNRAYYVFAQGEASTNVPHTGSVFYQGDAILINPDNYYGGLIEATTHFTADFDKKQILGTLSKDSKNLVYIEANINGNSFSGTNKIGVTETKTVGGFYGPDAAEIAGAFTSNNPHSAIKGGVISGVFGGKKQ